MLFLAVAQFLVLANGTYRFARSKKRTSYDANGVRLYAIDGPHTGWNKGSGGSSIFAYAEID
jgi:hypothetical protein